ncbi:AMP-binding protein [Nonomuraea sp. NPDC049480]|uniref:AMP-binding protein n=1 Tax=Nonomuraea sp. NPDC049480 TaxID=3364353 RepID=UPI003789421D
MDDWRSDPERCYREGWWRDATPLDDLRRAVERHPSRVAITAHRTDGLTRLTYADLSRLVERFAGALAGLGVGPGDVVGVQLPNWWQFPPLALACMRIGAVVNPIIPILRKREVGFMLERTEAKVCVAPATFRGFDHAGMLAEIAKEVPTLRHVVTVGGGPLDFDDVFMSGVMPAADARPGPAEASPDDLAQVMFTSGTTGEPKGVMHTHNTLYAGIRTEAEALGLGEDLIVHMGSPLTHQAGYLYCFLMPLQLGGRAVFQEVWDPDVMLELVESEGVNFGMGATTFAVDAIAAQRARPRDLTSLVAYACGGSPIPPKVVEEAREVLGVRMYALWGMTENATVTITRPEDPPDLAARSDGRPAPWMRVRIVNDRLQVRGANQCVGYWKRPDLYAESLTEDGWFDTGDLARDDGHGGIRITGRAKDLIVRGGEKIPVVEVEAALWRHPRIKEAALVAYPDERLGERACAVVVADGEPPSLPDLQRHLEELGMAKQFWPERLEVVAELPKTASGKVQKFELRERVG